MEFHGEFHVWDLNGDSTVRDSEPPTTKNKGVGLKPSTIWGLTPKPLGGVGGISMIYHNLLVKHGRTMFPANISLTHLMISAFGGCLKMRQLGIIEK